MKRKIPQRMCVGCLELKDKKSLIRIVKNKDGAIFYDPSGKANGRGAYICNNIDCFEKAIENKKIEKAFKQNLSNEIIDKLREDLKNEL
jgi:uncharacterized protein